MEACESESVDDDLDYSKLLVATDVEFSSLVTVLSIVLPQLEKLSITVMKHLDGLVLTPYAFAEALLTGIDSMTRKIEALREIHLKMMFPPALAASQRLQKG